MRDHWFALPLAVAGCHFLLSWETWLNRVQAAHEVAGTILNLYQQMCLLLCIVHDAVGTYGIFFTWSSALSTQVTE